MTGRAGPLVVVLSVFTGLGFGGFGAWWWLDAQPAPPERVEVVRPYLPEELEVACLPYMRKTATSLERAQTRVSALELRVRDKEREIAELEGRTREAAAPEVQVRLVQARAQLDGLEAALANARAEKADLLADLEAARLDLDRTRTALAAQERETRVAQREAADQRWGAFVREAQLTMCEQGSRARIERCREDVSSALDRYELRYKSCVRSGQAVPELRQDDGTDLPVFGIRLATQGPLRDWYVLFCDPMLPEAAGSAEPP